LTCSLFTRKVVHIEKQYVVLFSAQFVFNKSEHLIYVLLFCHICMSPKLIEFVKSYFVWVSLEALYLYVLPRNSGVIF
jgi:hypothetical protein